MGHERIGFLPKSKQWNDIVRQLQDYDGDPEVVAHIAADTLDALRHQYANISNDPSLISAIRFLAILCHSSGSETQEDELNSKGIIAEKEITMYSLMRGVDNYISDNEISLETSKLTKDSLMAAIITYQQAHETEQLSFDGFDSNNVWSGMDSGSAFCELARSFISEYTARNLNYYLERQSAREIKDYAHLMAFSKALKSQSAAIATHTKDISKLMQSLAAGWYNKNSTATEPNDSKIVQFLDFTFKKIREEFRREGESQ